MQVLFQRRYIRFKTPLDSEWWARPASLLGLVSLAASRGSQNQGRLAAASSARL